MYRPIVDHCEGRVFGYQALSRPFVSGRWIAPDMWFRAAAACGKAAEADLLSLRTVVHDLGQLPRAFDSLRWFVNVTLSNLCDPTFQERLEQVLTEGATRSQWVLEWVETVPYDLRNVAQHVRAFRQRGWRIALDNVGADASSLRALAELEPDFVKVGRSLIRGISTSASAQRLLARLVSFMGSPDAVIAEGVEDDEDLLALREAGVALSQGYYWSPSLLAGQLEFWHAWMTESYLRAWSQDDLAVVPNRSCTRAPYISLDMDGRRKVDVTG
ncbi:MAG: EAL domain-containing protein [Alicyclobacillaceae bacterium]|nr:EAL domain-containing protein [Alicyclobacillaceae bacterium]